MAAIDDYWQLKRPTIRERIAFFVNNEIMSDVKFVVPAANSESESKQVIPAHKFVLAVSSPVFFAMFYGQMAETSDSIELPDCNYESLLELFRYLYSDKVNLTGSNVIQVWYLARKYLVPSLAWKCIQFVRNKFQVEASNVFRTLPYAHVFQDKDLEDRCWVVVKKQTEEALRSDDFVTIERSLVESVVKREVLNVKEVELFKAVDRWATKECERQGISPDGEAKRGRLGEEIVKAIRFPLMSWKEFRSVTISRGTCSILRYEETSHMMSYYLDTLKTPLQFSPARRVDYHQCVRFAKFFAPSGTDKWNYEEKMDQIVFTVDRAIHLIGIQLFGSYERYNVTVEVRRSSKLMKKQSGIYSSIKVPLKEGYYYGFDVFFDHPIYFEPNNSYEIKSRTSGPSSWYGEGEKQSVECHGVVFNFIRGFPGTDRDTAHHLDGQKFPALLFRRA